MHCYIHKGDAKRGINTNDIVKTKDLCSQARKANINYHGIGKERVLR